MSIKITSLVKKYKNKTAVKGISFSAEKGEIVGFLGPNGAGKSTIMKMVTGFLKPSEGTIYVNGINVLTNPIKAQKNIGYLPEHNPLYLEMYVREYLQFQAALFSIKKNEIEPVINKVGLLNVANQKIVQLSKGYRQRVGLAAAILHNPAVLILDEPTTGLDPNQLTQIRALIKELGKDKTVLLSTHIMQEVEAVCNRILVINNGKIVADKTLKELQNTKTQTIHITFDFKIEKEFLQKLPNLQNIINTFDTSWVLTFATSKDMRPHLFDFAKDHGVRILELNLENKKLETLFKELTNT